MQKIFNKKNLFYTFIILLLTINLSLIISFYVHKNTFHIDELWSYAYANSMHGHNVVTRFNENKWIDGQQFHDFLTVQKKYDFDYGHIYKNVEYDMHTPLYYWVLYTLNYFYPDNFNKWTGGGLNIFLWILTLLTMYHLSKNFFDSPYMVFAPLILYSFSLIGISTVMYIRLYMMQTLWATILCDMMICYIKATDKFRRIAVAIFIFSLLGMLTSYNSIILSFLLSVVFGSYLLITKKIKKLLYLALAMIASLICFLTIFPAAWGGFVRFNPVTYQRERDIVETITSALNIFYTELFNINVNLHDNMIFICIFIILTLYLLVIYLYLVKSPNNKFFISFMAIAIITAVYLSYAMPEMFVFQDRYLMFLYPLLAVLTVFALYNILCCFIQSKKAIIVIYALLTINLCNVNYSRYCPYLMQQSEKDLQLLGMLKGKKIFVSAIQTWMDEIGSYIYQDAKQIYFPQPILHFYLQGCYTENALISVHFRVTSQQVIKLLDELKKADYLLMYNHELYYSKYDENKILHEKRKVCPNIANNLQFIDIVKIGNAYFDIYKVGQKSLLQMTD